MSNAVRVLIATLIAGASVIAVTPYRDEYKAHVLLLRTWWVPSAVITTMVSTDQATGESKLELYLGPKPWWPAILGEVLVLAGVAYVATGRLKAPAAKRPLRPDTSVSPERRISGEKSQPSPDPWSQAIAAAGSGNREEAIREFGRAIESNPTYYISEIKPSSAVAAACWQEAVDQHVRVADAKLAAGAPKTDCRQCGKDIGLAWHYDFESIAMARTVAIQCPDCGSITCKDDVKYGPDGNYPPCSACGVKVERLSAGPAVSSMVEQAQARRRYRGALKPPTALGRSVERG